MHTYIALLRGINVGGKNIIRMADLKDSFERMGFEDVRTFIQSGNVIFTSPESSIRKLEERIENTLSETFGYSSTVIVLSDHGLQKVVSRVPGEWKRRNDIRCYIAFIKPPATSGSAIKETDPKEGVDKITAGEGVLYMTTLLSGLTKSGITKLIGKPVYQSITIRNYNTARKLALLLAGN